MAGTEAGVDAVVCLGASPGVEIDDGGHADGDPFLPGPLGSDGSVTGVVARKPRRMREIAVSVEVHGPGVGLVVQEAVQAGGAPDPVAPGTGHAGLHETDRDLAHGKPIIGVPVEDVAHHGSLFLANLEAWRQSVRRGNFAIAEGHVAGHDRPLPGPPQLPSTVAFDDLGSFELGHCRLDLGDETTVGAVGEPALKEDHRNAKAVELIKHTRAWWT